MVDYDEIRRQYQAYMLMKNKQEKEMKEVMESELKQIVHDLPDGQIMNVEVDIHE